MHSGTTTGDVKSTFGEAERVAIKQFVVPLFGRFLKKCYSEFRPSMISGARFLMGLDSGGGMPEHGTSQPDPDSPKPSFRCRDDGDDA